MKQEAIFYIAQAGQDPIGPCSLAQMADLLRRKVITAETLARMEGDVGWEPFALLPQFNTILAMCSEPVPTPFDSPDQETSALPTPIRAFWWKTFLNLTFTGLLLLILVVLAYSVAGIFPMTVYVLMIGGGGISGVAHYLILKQLFGDDQLSSQNFRMLPFFDVFCSLDHFWENFPLLLAKYGGAAVAVGAALQLTGYFSR